MRVLLTGQRGFIGSALAPALRAAGHEVICLSTGVEDAAGYFAFPCVVHLACNTLGDWRSNIFGTANMLNGVAPAGRFIFASSMAAPLERDQYEADKLTGERIVRARPDIEAVILRLGNVYGPGRQSRRCVLNQLIRQAVAGEPLHLYGDAAGIRDYVYLDDVVRAFVLALDAPPGIYDVGTGIADSLVEAVSEVCRQTGHAWPTTGELTYSHAPLALESRWVPGWQPTVRLELGIATTIGWLTADQALADVPSVSNERENSAGMTMERHDCSSLSKGDGKTTTPASRGRFKVIGVDTFEAPAGADWVYAEYPTLEEAKVCAMCHGATFLKTHVYDDHGYHHFQAGRVS